jgi:hypothetical protein
MKGGTAITLQRIAMVLAFLVADLSVWLDNHRSPPLPGPGSSRAACASVEDYSLHSTEVGSLFSSLASGLRHPSKGWLPWPPGQQ